MDKYTTSHYYAPCTIKGEGLNIKHRLLHGRRLRYLYIVHVREEIVKGLDFLDCRGLSPHEWNFPIIRAIDVILGGILGYLAGLLASIMYKLIFIGGTK